MLEKTLRYQKTDHLVAIYLNHTPHGPTWKDRVLAELNELCDEIAWDEEVRVVMIGDPGEGPLSEETDLIKAVSMSFFEEETTFESLTEPISRLDRPVIAAISSDAVGQGLELALACDIRIASEASCFGFPQMKTGHLPLDGGTQRLSRLVGESKALEMILTGENIDAQEALRIGLVHKVVQREDLMKVTLKMAQEMASKGPIALRYAKEAIYKGMDMTLAQGLRLEADLYLLIHTTQDRQEGIQAFRKKKQPKFEGK
jgi:enoyl-CoA hydratase/carnithine racemase